MARHLENPPRLFSRTPNRIHPRFSRTFTAFLSLKVFSIWLAGSVGLPALAAPVPVPGNSPVRVELHRPGNPAVLPMTGTWRFKLEHGGSPAVRGELPADAPTPAFAAPGTSDAADAGWTNIPVPANWEIEGFSILTYQERSGNLSDDIGLYRRFVNVPASFANQKVLWHFDGVFDGAEVFVNGLRCGYHESGFTAFDIDVTKALQPGQRNLFAVRVYKKTSSGPLDRGDFWCLGGIYRENYLVALPQLHVDDVTVVTGLDDRYTDATLKSTLRVAGPPGAHFHLTGELYSFDGKKVATPVMSLAGNIGAEGIATVVMSAPVTAPKLWSAEKPNLHYVFYRLSDGNRTVERVQERIGFRQVELRNGVVEVNGVPVKFTGVCRHDEYSPYGHALTEECFQKDIALLKAANVSAIRTSHYNDAGRFMELCDEAGFYVLDEIPSCWVAGEIKDPNRTWAYVFRSQETVARDKNRACVLVWSCGNESSYGINNQAEFDYVKAHDPTRLALISQQGIGPNPKSDFDDYHYPPVPQMKLMLASANRAKVPAIYTEIGGIEDPWGKILEDNWGPIWSSDGITGAFIWEWQEQKMADRFTNRWNIPSPGARGLDRASGMRLAGGGGAVTADRQIKPDRYWNLKMVYSPVTISAREIAPVAGKCVVPVQNRYSFTDLGELACRWEAFAGERQLARGEIRIPAKPRSTVDASFPASAGMDTLRIEFIHPDGRSVYATRLYVKGYDGPAAPAALAATGQSEIAESAEKVTVSAGGSQFVVDKLSAQLMWHFRDQAVILGGPILNLGESLPDNGPRAGGGTGARGRGAVPVVTSAQPPRLANVLVNAKMDGGSARLDVTADVYLTGSDELKGLLNYTLVVSPDAQSDLAWSLDWKATNSTAREAGLKFVLPASTDCMTWSAESLWTEYPPDHIGKPYGFITSKDANFAISRRDIRWISFSGTGKNSLVILNTGKPLHAHARAEASATTLFLSSAIGSSGRDVTGDEIRLSQATPLSGGFRFRLAGSTK
jgi:beta-galactosidase